jgi:hypothetical protein
MPQALLLLHAAATWAMVGLIWTMQVVHYPLLAGLDSATYPRWQREHMARIARLVGPLMVVEAVTAGLLLVPGLTPAPQAWALSGLCLLALAWLSTALIQAPLHGRLAGGFAPALHRRLIRTNWLRTALWTLRGGVAGVLLARTWGASP